MYQVHVCPGGGGCPVCVGGVAGVGGGGGGGGDECGGHSLSYSLPTPTRRKMSPSPLARAAIPSLLSPLRFKLLCQTCLVCGLCLPRAALIIRTRSRMVAAAVCPGVAAPCVCEREREGEGETDDSATAGGRQAGRQARSG